MSPSVSKNIRGPSSFGNAKVAVITGPASTIAPVSAKTAIAPDTAIAPAVVTAPKAHAAASHAPVVVGPKRRRRRRARKRDNEEAVDNAPVEKVQLGPRAKLRAKRRTRPSDVIKAAKVYAREHVEPSEIERAREVEKTRHGPVSTESIGMMNTSEQANIVRDGPTTRARRRRQRRHRDHHPTSDARTKKRTVGEEINATAAQDAAAAVAIFENTAERALNEKDFKNRALLKVEENRASTTEVERISRRGPNRKKKHAHQDGVRRNHKSTKERSNAQMRTKQHASADSTNRKRQNPPQVLSI